jgi:hypothetical protein
LKDSDICDICGDVAAISLKDFESNRQFLLCKKHRDGWIMSHMQPDMYIQLMNEDQTLDFIGKHVKEDLEGL